MLHEFAIEPTVIRSWDRLQFYMSNFGVEHGRLIARYPKKWERLVNEGLSHCKDVEKKRIVEALARGKNRLFPRHHEWNDLLRGWRMWLKNTRSDRSTLSSPRAIQPTSRLSSGTTRHHQPATALDGTPQRPGVAKSNHDGRCRKETPPTLKDGAFCR